MTLLAEIQAAFPGLTPETRDDGAIAARLSQGRKKVVSTLGGIGTIMEALGAADGAALLDTLTADSATNAAVKWGMVLVNRGEFDFGSDVGRTVIDQVVSNPVQNTKLKAVAEIPDVVTPQEVAKALEGAL